MSSRHAAQSGRYFAWRRPRPDVLAHFQVLIGWRWIVAGAVVCLVALARVLVLPLPHRGRAIGAMVAGGGAAGVLTLLAGIRNAAIPLLKRVDLPLADLPPSLAGRMIAQISDLHLGVPLSRSAVRRALAAVQAARPDLIVITGDFVSYTRHLPLLREALQDLRAPYGLYASLGNHDHWTDLASLARLLGECRVRLLVNEHRAVTIGDATLVIAGVDDLWDGRPDLDAALAGVPAGAPIILLAHSPDYADRAAQSAVAVQLAGHSHGGHIRLPLLGPLLLPRHGVRYDRGLRRVGRMWLYVSHGLGGWPLRVGCRAEVTLFTLRPAS